LLFAAQGFSRGSAATCSARSAKCACAAQHIALHCMECLTSRPRARSAQLQPSAPKHDRTLRRPRGASQRLAVLLSLDINVSADRSASAALRCKENGGRGGSPHACCACQPSHAARCTPVYVALARSVRECVRVRVRACMCARCTLGAIGLPRSSGGRTVAPKPKPAAVRARSPPAVRRHARVRRAEQRGLRRAAPPPPPPPAPGGPAHAHAHAGALRRVRRSRRRLARTLRSEYSEYAVPTVVQRQAEAHRRCALRQSLRCAAGDARPVTTGEGRARGAPVNPDAFRRYSGNECAPLGSARLVPLRVPRQGPERVSESVGQSAP
jgi:hypothetical protein